MALPSFAGDGLIHGLLQKGAYAHDPGSLGKKAVL